MSAVNSSLSIRLGATIIVIVLVVEHVIFLSFLAKPTPPHLLWYFKRNTLNNSEYVKNTTVQNVVAEPKNTTENVTVLYGCAHTLQTLMFCDALREANISFKEDEVKFNQQIHVISFRNKDFPIIISLRITKACYKVTPERYLLCNEVSSTMEKSSMFSNDKEHYYVQVMYLVLMGILPQWAKKYNAGHYFPYFRFEESFASNDQAQLKLWHEENLDKLIEHHTLNVNDVIDLKGKSIVSFGDILTNNNTIPVHIFSYVNNNFPRGNVGDTLGPYITAKLTNKSVTICTASINLRNTSQHLHILAATGSILPIIPRNGIIWSSGYLTDAIKASPSNLYLSVRGQASRLMLVLQNEYLQWAPTVSGDSGLLLPLLYYPQRKSAKHEVCVVLHFIDDNIKNIISANVTLLSISTTVEDFIDRILACKTVLSSSLHGLIIAHSYHISATGIKVSDNVEGADFKFSDHYRSLGIYMENYRTHIPLQNFNNSLKYFTDLVKNTPQPTVEKIKELQAKLLKTFPLKTVEDPMDSVMVFKMF